MRESVRAKGLFTCSLAPRAANPREAKQKRKMARDNRKTRQWQSWSRDHSR
jgi:hypothetical protein